MRGIQGKVQFLQNQGRFMQESVTPQFRDDMLPTQRMFGQIGGATLLAHPDGGMALDGASATPHWSGQMGGGLRGGALTSAQRTSVIQARLAKLQKDKEYLAQGAAVSAEAAAAPGLAARQQNVEGLPDPENAIVGIGSSGVAAPQFTQRESELAEQAAQTIQALLPSAVTTPGKGLPALKNALVQSAWTLDAHTAQDLLDHVRDNLRYPGQPQFQLYRDFCVVMIEAARDLAEDNVAINVRRGIWPRRLPS